MKKLVAGFVVLLVAGAFLAGWWPQRERHARAEAESAECRRQLAEARTALGQAEARARLGRLFGRFLALEDAVASGNYGEARALSSPFFDLVRDEAAKTTDAAVRASLDAVLARRDTVTAGLARAEASVRDVLVPIGRDLRRALGYPMPALTPPEGGNR
jgi:hypothetical protein